MDKRDKRPKNGAWAAGSYASKCVYCNSAFLGDKRAAMCAPCAYQDVIKTEIDDMPDKVFLINMADEIVWCDEIDPSGDINKDDTTEYTKTSTVNKKIVDALNKVTESVDVLQSAGSLNIFSLMTKLIEIKKQYKDESHQ